MKKITILLLTAAALASGCKRFTDINQNPNQPTSVTPNVLLSAALASSGASVATDFQAQARWMGYWSRSGNYIADIPTESYAITTSYADGSFQDLYNTLNKYHNIDIATGANPFYLGVSKTMKALHFSTLVDCFNNVPYSQAFNISHYITPKYDAASTIYTSLIGLLDSAVTQFTAAKTYYANAASTVLTTDNNYDIMFGRGAAGGATPAASSARMDKWIAFANTLKLKLLDNASAVSAFSSIAPAEATKAGGVFMTPGLIASVNPGYSTANQQQVSPLYGSFYTNAGSATQANYYRANNYAINFYNSSADTSRPQLAYVPTSGTTVVGNYDGDPASASNSVTSAVGTGILKGPTQDQLIISDFEGLFVQAEAAARGYIPGGTATAETLLKEAIEQSFIYLGSTAASADAYYAANLTNPNVTIEGALANPILSTAPEDKTPGMQAILTQKWIALNGVNWIQAWTDFRRSGFPLYNLNGTGFFGPSHAQTHVTHTGVYGSGAYIPYRFLYPQSEFDTNGANVPQGITQYSTIFWDTREK